MDLKEVLALIILYRACQDKEVRRKALQLVPDLQDLVELEDHDDR